MQGLREQKYVAKRIAKDYVLDLKVYTHQMNYVDSYNHKQIKVLQ